MGKSSPAPVDYRGAALAEGEMARENIEAQTWANRPTQINPWGQVDWWNTPEWDPTTNQYINRWTQETTLTPGMQEALDAQIGLQSGRSQIAAGMLGDIAGSYQQPIDWSQYGNMLSPNVANQPDLWAHMQWDIPEYQTTGQVRQLDFSNMPEINDPRQGMSQLYNVQDPTGRYGEGPGIQDTTGMYGNLYGVNDPQWTVQRAENAHYDRQAQRLNEQFGSQQQALDIKLRNQGLVPGDEAYQAQMQNLGRTMNDAFQNARNESIMAGGAEAQRMYGMEMGLRQQGQSEIGQRFGEQMGLRGQYMDEIDRLYGQQMGLRGMGMDEVQALNNMQMANRGMFSDEMFGLGNFANQAAMNEFDQMMRAGSQGYQDTLSAAQFQNLARSQGMDESYRYADYMNQLRQQAINEMITQRGFTLNEANALMSGQQIGLPQFNQFMGAQAAQTPQLLQAAMLQGQQNAANASGENAMFGNLMGGLSSLAGTAGMFGFSDRRLKSNIQQIGQRNGVNWYSYTIFGKPQIGVMADEVPWATMEHPSGYLMVDYSRV